MCQMAYSHVFFFFFLDSISLITFDFLKNFLKIVILSKFANITSSKVCLSSQIKNK